MELFQQTIDRLASPLVLFSAALLLLVVASRTRFLLDRLGAVVLSIGTAAVLAAGLSDARFRELVLDPARLPAAVWILMTLVFLWLALHRAQVKSPEPASGSADGSTREAAVVACVGYLVMAGAFFLEPPLGRSALDLSAAAGSAAAGSPAAGTPWFLRGFQELGLYFSPWMAAYGLPAVLVAALLALPYLDFSAAVADDSAGERRRLLTFATACLLLVVLPVLVATFLRGPQGEVFGPFEVRDAARPQAAPAVPLSEAFWCRWLGRAAPPSPWLLRELPGALLLLGYFGLLPWMLARWSATRRAVERFRQAAGPWRYRLTVALTLILAVVPLKMYGRWLLDVGPWLDLPELSVSF
jgi:hypothetical protein